MMKDKNSIRKIEDKVVKAFSASGVKSVLVAVSGGADSVALLCACDRVAPRLGLRVEAVNCNFHLRGEESDRDSIFTAALCERLSIPLHSLEYNVESYMNEHPGISTEMACRELRYADFFRICSEIGIERIAVAHNAGDDIETMILALLRGSGTRGLRGMDADNGRIIRPLLGVTRAEIEGYLTAIGQDFVTDSSNLSSDYRRNFIRRDVIPLLERRWPGVWKSLARTLSIIKEESAIVEDHYRHQLAELCPDSTTLLVYTDGVTTGTVFRFIHPFDGNLAISEEIIGSLNKDYGKRSWKLSDKYEATLERDRLIIIDKDKEPPKPSLIWEKMEMTADLMDEIRKNHSHEIIYLPHGESDYELRRPQTGDRLRPLGMKGTRLVSDIISEARLDSRHRESVHVLVRISDGEIIWVTGLKRSRYELVDSKDAYAFRVVHKEARSRSSECANVTDALPDL